MRPSPVGAITDIGPFSNGRSAYSGAKGSGSGIIRTCATGGLTGGNSADSSKGITSGST